MTIKAYFDCEWTGPKVEVDSKGNVTAVEKGSVGECSKLLPLSLHHLITILHKSTIVADEI